MWHHKYVEQNIESKEILETISSCEHVKEKREKEKKKNSHVFLLLS